MRLKNSWNHLKKRASKCLENRCEIIATDTFRYMGKQRAHNRVFCFAPQWNVFFQAHPIKAGKNIRSKNQMNLRQGELAFSPIK